MIVAAHQPAFLPWLGYFDKLARCDVFVLMDDVQFEQRNFQNRNRVKVSTGPTWVTVPVEKGSQQDRILDKRIVNMPGSREHWARKVWVTLLTHYGKAAHFARYEAELEETFARTWDRLVDLDVHLMQSMITWLGITTPIVKSSSLGIETMRSQRIVDTCLRLGADTYLSGKGGSLEYLDRDLFERSGIRIAWQEFNHPIYPQRYPAIGFCAQLSAIDLLLNCGPSSGAILSGQPAAAALAPAEPSTVAG